ncbi:MAG: asparagine synthase (glutamine-hydrolyzing) [Flavobacteriales bacterium]|nr:asparagine synthase (glutamine-hydrolyzing) [Flavobacteriales bacterium]
MCGITGFYSMNGPATASPYAEKLDAAIETMALRGPDGSGKYIEASAALGHARLAIIDTSASANQPFTDNSGRYTIVFNGEIYNYREIQGELTDFNPRTTSDTEILLQGYIEWGEKVLKRLNGFFAFAIHDKETDELFLARDRMGIKPLLVYQDENAIVFGSEMKSLMAFGIPREIDVVSQALYHQFNYTPYPETIFKNVVELESGSWMRISGLERDPSASLRVANGVFWSIPKPTAPKTRLTYEQAQQKLRDLMEKSVQRRMIADVPLGSFLSGGIDSSIIATLAARQTDKLNTFSIGYADEPLFDETHYAEAVAKKIGSNHTVFKLTNDDLYADLHHVLNYIDRPFADSSALPVHILCKHTRKHVTVALSGDGADELFSGYNKHAAEFRARNLGLKEQIAAALKPLWFLLPASRNSSFGNTVRQLQKFSEGVSLGPKDRFWNWASFWPENEVDKLIRDGVDKFPLSKGVARNEPGDLAERKKRLTAELGTTNDLDEVLYTDLHQVLRNDMLTKVDLMSMANSLEVRVPFLDHELVEFACSLPEEYKITANIRKRILQETFRADLPEMLFRRPKHGFEVPLLNWFKGELDSLIKDDLLSRKLIEEQEIFSWNAVQSLINKLHSNDPGDSATHIWNLIVFQTWWKRYIRH